MAVKDTSTFLDLVARGVVDVVDDAVGQEVEKLSAELKRGSIGPAAFFACVEDLREAREAVRALVNAALGEVTDV